MTSAPIARLEHVERFLTRATHIRTAKFSGSMIVLFAFEVVEAEQEVRLPGKRRIRCRFFAEAQWLLEDGRSESASGRD